MIQGLTNNYVSWNARFETEPVRSFIYVAPKGICEWYTFSNFVVFVIWSPYIGKIFDLMWSYTLNSVAIILASNLFIPFFRNDSQIKMDGF